MKRAVAVAGTAVCALAAALGVRLWSASGDPEPTSDHLPARAQRPPRTGGLADGALSQPGGALAIRGRVVGPGGPVAGAVVAAFAPYDEATDLLARSLCPPGRPKEDPFECTGDETAPAVTELFASRALERPALARATTDAQGRFALEGLADGAYDVWAERAGGFAHEAAQDAPADDLELTLEPGVLVQGKVEVDEAAPKGPLLVSGAAAELPRIFEAQTGEGGAFTLGPMPASEHTVVSTFHDGYVGEFEVVDETEAPEEGVTLSLSSPHRITGVVLEDGKPVAGVTVSVEAETNEVLELVSDAAGRFAFERVRAGEYTVRGKRPFAVAQDQVVVPFNRDPPPVALELQPVGSVRGVVRDEAGHAVEGAAVYLAGVDVVKTTPDGRFELTAVGASEHLLVRADGFLNVDEELSIPPGAPLEHDVTLHHAIVLRGRVVDEAGQPVVASIVIRENDSSDGDQTVSAREGSFELEADRPRVEVDVRAAGYVVEHRVLVAGSAEQIVLHPGGTMLVRLVDTSGKPVADGEVSASPIGGSPERKTLVGRHEAPQNEYLFSGVTAGDYRVEVSSPAGVVVRTVRSDGRGHLELAVTLPALGTLSGIAVSSSGQPLPDVYIRAIELLEGERTHSIGGDRTDAKGEFHIPAGRGGRYKLFAFKDNRPAVRNVAASADGAPVRIVLRDPAKMRGRVLYPDGTPATAFTVNGERERALDGRFEVEVPPGDLNLSLGAPGYASQIRSVTVRDGEDRDLGDLPLAEGRTLAVRVVDARTGAPVRGASVHVSGVDVSGDQDLASPLSDEPTRRTRSDGSAALEHVPDRAVLAVEADGYEAAAQEVGAGGSETVRLQPNGTLRVLLDEPFDGPLWASIEGPVDKVLPMDPVAGAAFPGLPSGDYLVMLWTAPPPAGQRWNGTVAPVQPQQLSFPANGSTELHFHLRAAGTDVTVQLAGVGVDWEVQLMLLKDGVNVAALQEDPLHFDLTNVLVPERPGHRSPARFAHVPDGSYRAAVMILGPAARGLYASPELVVVHGPGAREVTLTLPADWRPPED